MLEAEPPLKFPVAIAPPVVIMEYEPAVRVPPEVTLRVFAAQSRFCSRVVVSSITQTTLTEIIWVSGYPRLSSTVMLRE